MCKSEIGHDLRSQNLFIVITNIHKMVWKVCLLQEGTSFFTSSLGVIGIWYVLLLKTKKDSVSLCTFWSLWSMKLLQICNVLDLLPLTGCRLYKIINDARLFASSSSYFHFVAEIFSRGKMSWYSVENSLNIWKIVKVFKRT